MRRLRPSSEAEMVALFLRSELSSDRFGTEIRALLERGGVPEHIVTVPDIGDDAANQMRMKLLSNVAMAPAPIISRAFRTASAGTGWPSPG